MDERPCEMLMGVTRPDLSYRTSARATRSACGQLPNSCLPLTEEPVAAQFTEAWTAPARPQVLLLR